MKKCYVCCELKELSDFRKDKSKKDGLMSKCKKCDNQRTKIRYKKKRKENEEFRKRQNKLNELRRQKREKIDELFKLKRRLRGTIRDSFRRMGYKKNSKSENILGAEWEVVKNYFETKFTDGMSWDNIGEWHFDHIYPISLGSNEEEIIKLCHYTNLQPLWAEDNLRKSNNII